MAKQEISLNFTFDNPNTLEQFRRLLSQIILEKFQVQQKETGCGT